MYFNPWQELLNRGSVQVALIICMAIPLLIPAVPPFLDLPGHIGSYFLSINSEIGSLTGRYYAFHWAVIGNLGVDVLVWLFTRIIGVEPATKLVVTCIPMLTALGMLMIAKEVHGSVQPTALLALPFAYCYPLHYGFVNYCLSMAFALLAFGLWLRIANSDRRWYKWLVFSALAPIVWIAHAVGWGLLCVMCFSFEAYCLISAKEIRVATIAYRVWPLALLLGPVAIMALTSSENNLNASGWFNFGSIAKWVITVARDRWPILDLISAGLVFFVMGLAVIRVTPLKTNPALASVAAALLAVYVCAPNAIGGSYFVQARIFPYALVLGLLSIDTSGLSRTGRSGIATLSSAFFTLRLGATAISLFIYGQSYNQHMRAIDLMPVGSSVVSLTPAHCSASLGNWMNSRLQHIDGLALERRQLFVNDQWTGQGLQLVRVHNKAAFPFTSEPSELVTTGECASMPGTRTLEASLRAVPRDAFDFVWLLDTPINSRPSLDWLVPIWSTQQSVLYRIVK